ncbi:MAG: cytidine deaminase [Bacilli bacterium]|nr:cytidine deaminase [Bacilli bacterium]
MQQELKELLNNAYAPYSNYQVAAIIKMKDGKTFPGVNVENASYGATICAERNAINSAISHGYKKGDFEVLYLMNSSNKIGFPCFICRQTFSEFFDLDMDVIMYTKDGQEQKLKVKDLVINPFTSDSLL